MKRKKRILLLIILAALLLCAAVTLILNAVVIGSTKGQIHEITPEDGYETALILGAKVHADGTLSDMLRDRMDAGIALYKNGAVKKLLLSGDDSGEWGEVTAMKAYAIQNGVSDEDILTDGEGYSTYESVSRAKELYGIHKLVIVTQKYHLYRALYIANDMDMTALGADAALYTYAGQWYREIREMLARIKDFGLCLFN